MRSVWIALAILLMGGGVLYFFVLSGPSTLNLTQQERRDTRLATLPTTSPFDKDSLLVGMGQGVVIETLDPRTGRLASSLVARKYEPQRDGTVDIDSPVATFFMNDGGSMVLRGSSAKVIVENDPHAPRNQQAVEARMPSRGEMRDVTIAVYETLPESGQPILTVEVPNLTFDSLQFRVQTMAGDVNGTMTQGDQIPVTVRGRDFEFDGTGMTMAWNSRESRLELLEIIHGKRLLVKNPRALGLVHETKLSQSGRNRSGGFLSGSARSAGATSFWGMVIAAVVGDVRLTAATRPESTTRPKRVEPVYRVRFSDNVVVKEADQAILTSSKLEVLLRLRQDDKRASPQRAQSPETALRQATGGQVHLQPKAGASDTPQTPLEVTWSGSLRVTPDPSLNLPPNGFGVDVEGQPLMVSRQGFSIGGHRLVATAGPAGLDQMLLSASAAVPTVSLRDANGSSITASSVDFDQARGDIRLRGEGMIVTPARAVANQQVNLDQPGQGDSIEWSEQATLNLTQVDRALRLNGGSFAGDVRVRRRDVHVAADRVEFEMAERTNSAGENVGEIVPGFDSAQIKTLRASGRVNVLSTSETGRLQQFASDQVALEFVAGAAGANHSTVTRVDAKGNVVLNTDGALVQAGRLVAEPDPQAFAREQNATDKDVRQDGARPWSRQFLSLDLSEGVSIARADFTAQGDSVVLETAHRHTLVLRGSPATVTSNQGTIAASNIRLGLLDSALAVPDAGQIRQVVEGDGGQVVIAWKGQMKYDPQLAVADFNGGIELTQVDAQGRSTTLTGDTATVKFRAAPGGEKNAHTQGAQVGAAALHGEIDFVSIEGGTRVTVVSPDASRDRFTRVTILSDKLEFDQVQQSISMLQKGRLLVQGVKLEQAGAMPGQRPNRDVNADAQTGNAAVAWNDRLSWKLSTGELSIIGQTTAAFEPDANQAGEVGSITRLFASRMDVLLTPMSIGQGLMQGSGEGLQLRSASASGEVSVRSDSLSFDAGRLDFDARTNLATASGGEGRSVEVFAGDGRSSARFLGLKWDVASGQVKDLAGIDVRTR